jgi:hypothetical protein
LAPRGWRQAQSTRLWCDQHERRCHHGVEFLTDWTTCTSADGRRRRHVPGNMPALGMAVPPCRRSRRAATLRGSLLTNIFRGGLFWHYVGVGGPMRQKFHGVDNFVSTKQHERCHLPSAWASVSSIVEQLLCKIWQALIPIDLILFSICTRQLD